MSELNRTGSGILGNHDKGRRWRWLDILRNAEHGMTMGEGYLLAELVRRSSDQWTSNPYQRSVLHAHGLDQEGVFVTWPSTATLAKVLGCSDKHVRTLSKTLQKRGYLTVFTNAGGTGENRARTNRPNLYVIDAQRLPEGLSYRVEPEVRESEPTEHRVEPEVRGGAPIGAPGWKQRCSGVEPEVHQIVIDLVKESKGNRNNSLNAAEIGQRETESVKADEQPAPAVSAAFGSSAGLAGVKDALQQAREKEAATA